MTELSKRRNGNRRRVSFDVESEVLRRYGAGAERLEPGLCCPAKYDPGLLALIPREILEKDYGCGDPSPYVGEGDRVVDLGSGAGKVCYILAQKVGARGEVIGVDFNDKMLALARRYRDQVAENLGFANVRFVKGRIQDLALDLEKAEAWLEAHPVRSMADLVRFEAECDRLRREEPLIPDASVDAVVSNCVLNLVRPDDKERLFAEIHRVLRRGGRAVISDIVCDEDPPASITDNPTLWSDCIAGAFREDRFLEMFERAGLYGIEILSWQREPWRVVEGIEFRSVVVQAFKGKEGPCLERNQAVVYRGPWKSVTDDDGHTLVRGRRTAVCDKTFRILTDPSGPYAQRTEPVEPRTEVAPEDAAPFACGPGRIRSPRETKGESFRGTTGGTGACGPGCC